MTALSLLTMTPVIRTGRACFDGRRLPRDEFAARVQAVEVMARREQLDAIVVLANAASPGPVVHLTNYAPTAGVATVVCVPGHPPVLMAGRGGRREEQYQRDVTWVPDLRQRPFGADSVREVLAERGVPRGRLGVAGLDDQVPIGARQRFLAGMGNFDLVPVERELASLRRASTARERAVLGEADGILALAVTRGVAAFAASGVPSRGALAIETAAYELGCRDVRLLLGHGDGSLRPFEALDGKEEDLLACYVAAEHLGYWAERAFTFPWSAAPADADLRPAVDAVAARCRPGRHLADLPTAGLVLGEGAGAGEHPRTLHVRAVGTELVELPDEAATWTELREGDALSLVVTGSAGGYPALHGRTVVVGADGPRPLPTLAGAGLR